MKGAHSADNARRTGARGRGKVVAIAIVIAIVVLVVAAVCLLQSGRFSLSVGSSTSSSSSSSVAQDAFEQEERSSDASVTEAIGVLDASVPDTSAYEPQAEYVNARYGFSVKVPDRFVLGSEIDDGAGVMLTSNPLRMTVTVLGYDNDQNLSLDAVKASLWNGSEDSIVRMASNRVVIYQYDDEYEYFIWAYVGAGSINQMTIRYPLQDDNRDELDATQALMQGFLPGDLDVPH